jgi:hypothetical protein
VTFSQLHSFLQTTINQHLGTCHPLYHPLYLDYFKSILIPPKSVKMQFAKLAIVAGLAASVSAWTNETWVTTTVDVYTTVCPYATHMTFNGVTYTATAVR